MADKFSCTVHRLLTYCSYVAPGGVNTMIQDPNSKQLGLCLFYPVIY